MTFRKKLGISDRTFTAKASTRVRRRKRHKAAEFKRNNIYNKIMQYINIQ